MDATHWAWGRVPWVAKQFGEQPGIEAVVEPEGGLLELFGAECVTLCCRRIEPGQIERGGGPLWEEFVTEAVGLHRRPSTTWAGKRCLTS